MTPQEAIYELAEACLVRCAGEPSEDCLDCEINMAMEALEKQNPKKPVKADTQEFRHMFIYICPSCSKEFSGTGIANYCYHCGQRLDWSDQE